jgi:hypothetical protein
MGVPLGGKPAFLITLEEMLKRGMSSWEGSHDGSFYAKITSKMHKVYSVEFMKVHWKSSGGKLVEYDYKLVY